jgi:hypothetical protein
MAQWGKTDTASNSVSWAPALLKTTANTSNRDALFGNTTADAFVAGATIGMYGVSTAEMRAERADGGERPTSSGWVLRTEGSGGRSGRVSYETLVAMRSITGDASDDAVLQDAFITIVTQPSADSANSSADEQATFVVTATAVPSGTSLTYQWQGNSSGSFANLSNGSGVGGATTTTLTLDANTVAAQSVRVLVLATGANTKTSSAAAYTVTS